MSDIPFDSRRLEKKAMKNTPLFYNECKKPRTIFLTNTAVKALDEESATLNKSRSELLEIIIRERYSIFA